MAGQRSRGRLRRAGGPKHTAAGWGATAKVAGRKRTAAAAKAAGKSEYLFSYLVFSLCVQFICKVNNLQV